MNYYDPNDLVPDEEYTPRQYHQMTYEQRMDFKTLLNHLHIEDVFYAQHVLKGIIYKKGHLRKTESKYRNPLDKLFKDGENDDGY